MIYIILPEPTPVSIACRGQERFFLDGLLVPAGVGSAGARGVGGYLTKCNMEGAPPRSPTPYPFIYHFGRKGAPFRYLLFKKRFSALLSSLLKLPFKKNKLTDIYHTTPNAQT